MKLGRFLSATVLTGLAVFALASTGLAQTGKVGYVDSDKIFSEFKEWAKAQDQFNTEYKAWDDEAKGMQKELEDMIVEYDKQKLILSADKKKEREAAIEAKRQALDSYTKDVFGPAGRA
ncbi:MAG: OmpH family outer membrane protein, partial [candidate division Zixibacteria bacterium]|nr:OmpH family outer membrane protein [candidate division Zixibacteria bacterium]